MSRINSIKPQGLFDIMLKPSSSPKIKPISKTSAYEKLKAEVYARGNKWEIENFHATHD